MQPFQHEINFEYASRIVQAVDPASWEIVDITLLDNRTVGGVLRATHNTSKAPAIYATMDPLSGNITYAALVRLEDCGRQTSLDDRDVKLSPLEAINLARIAQSGLLQAEALQNNSFGDELQGFRT